MLSIYQQNISKLTSYLLSNLKRSITIINSFFMKYKTNYLITSLFTLLFSIAVFGQNQQTISGKVVDAAGIPLIGVSIMVKGSANGTITNNDGNFIIKSVKEGSIVSFSYIGYVPQEVKFKGQQFIKIELSEDLQSLSEVQVIGYGQKKKVTMTGAVVSIGTAELLKSPAPNVGNILAGNLSGVSSVQYSGQPGADNPEIYVRGIGSLLNAKGETTNSSPLILVDGVERSFLMAMIRTTI